MKNLAIDADQLLHEASTWSPTERINWSKLGERYGLKTPNRGQVIKEFLQENHIPAASVAQRTTRTPRRPKKKFRSGRTSFPMYKPVSFEKHKIQDKISRGEVTLGDEVVVSTYKRYKINPEDNTIMEENDKVSARRIPMLQIRKKLLQKHEELGVIRNQPDVYFDTLASEDVRRKLFELHVSFSPCETIEVLREKLKQMSRQRFLKVWHDHATVAGHGHFLVLLSCVYDPAFYYTPAEMKTMTGVEVDVPTLVETPEIHILGRSGSSLNEQAQFSKTRRECLEDLSISLQTATGITINDICRFFHGDGPAAQFETGHNIGGNYSCAGCGAKSSCFDDLAYCYRCPKPSLAERQQFVLQGKVWKQKQGNWYIPHLIFIYTARG